LDDLVKKYHFNQINMRSGKIIGLVVLAIILILVPLVVDSPYYIHLLIMVGINAALAMTFILLLRTGLITLAIAAFWGIGAYSSTLLAMRLGLPFWLDLPAATIITGTIGLIIGYLLVRNSGFGFIIMSLVLGFVTFLVFGTFDFFGGYIGIVNIPRPESIPLPFLAPIEFTSKVPFYYLMLFLVLIVVLALSAFYSAWSGRAWRAIGLSPRLAESLGVSLFKYRLLAFVIAAAVPGLMGSFYAHYFGAIVPGTFEPFKTIYCHVYAILGGIGNPIAGPVLGALIMTIVPEILRVTADVEPMITGALVILLVMFLPNGLLGLLSLRHGLERPSASIARISNWFRESLPNRGPERGNRK